MATPHNDDATPAHDIVTTADLDLIDKLDKEATPGPWLTGDHVGEPRALCTAGDTETSLLGLDRDGMAIFCAAKRTESVANASLTAHARTLLPRLAWALRAEREDQRIAAGECLVSLPEPGTDAARLLRANRLLSYERNKAQKEARDAYARGRREALEEAASFLRADGHGFATTAYRLAATDIEHNEAKLRSK